MKFGEFFRKRRKELELTVRKFAKEKGYDVGYISRLENGLIAPPADQGKIDALGEALELQTDSKEWAEYLDLVAIARNEVPKDLQTDEVALKILPAFYKSLRKENLSANEAKKLIDLIEKSREE